MNKLITNNLRNIGLFVLIGLLNSGLSANIRPVPKITETNSAELSISVKDLTPKDIKSLIKNITKLIDERFVDIAAGERVVEGINKYNKSGRYKNLKNDADFARAINKDLYALSNDLHLRVQPIDVGNSVFKRPDNGFFSSQILHGNIGYLKVNGLFAPLEDTKVREDMESAMLKIKDADAILFDLRNVPGGMPETISLLSSYLYDSKPRHQNTYYNRLTGPKKLFTRPDEVPFHFGLKRPLYVLINGGTGSAAEAFTYHNQQNGRVVVIGEKSMGAGRLSSPHPISETLYLLVPENRSEHPISKTGFEQVGVIPDIKVAGEDISVFAHKIALNNLIKNNADNSKWKKALSSVEADSDKTKGELGEYAGKYGERSILISGDGLVYKPVMGPELVLKEIQKDLYKIILPPNVRSRGATPNVRFDRNEKGKIKSLSLISDDGSVQGTFQKEQ